MDNKIENEGIMYNVLKRYGLYEQREDYIDLCYIGYAKALNKFDKSKANIRTYIYKCVENEILQELRKEKAQKRQRYECSLDDEYDDRGHTFIETIADDIDLERDIICEETNKELCEAVNKLSYSERFVISHLFELNKINYTPNKICKVLNITTDQLEEIKTTALAKLKEMLGDIR